MKLTVLSRPRPIHSTRHLQTPRELPADLVIPPRLMVTVKSFAAVAERIKNRRRPTKAMRDLLAGRSHEGEP